MKGDRAVHSARRQSPHDLTMAQNVVVPPFDVAPETVVGPTPQSVFAFQFPFWEKADLIVKVNGLKLPLSDFSVQGLFVQNGEPVEGGYGSGEVTLNTPVSNSTVVIDRRVLASRETAFSRSSPLQMPALNADLNKLTARQQDVERQVRDVEAGVVDPDLLAEVVDGATVNKADRDGANILTSEVQPFRASIGISAPTRAALMAAKVTDSIFVSGRSAIGDGYAGTFEWQAGDQYAGVIEDPLQGIWVPRDGDPTGSTGAWKRVFDGHVNPVWFGAGAGGDDTAAFSAAARTAFVTDYIGGNLQSSLARPFRGYVQVPAGTYTLGSLVDTSGRDIIWVLDQAAIVTNPENLNGQIWRGDNRVTVQNPFGIADYANGFTASLGGAIPDKPAPITGIVTLQQLADYPDRDAVALIGASYSPTATHNVASATYTATTCTFLNPSANVLKRLRRGMVIDTKHATRCSGLVSSWATVGSNLVITVAEWRAKGGSSAVTPANGTGLYVNRISKVWGANIVTNLLAGGDADQAIGIETSVYNGYGAPTSDITDTTNRVWGNYVFNAGPFKTQASFMSSGGCLYGFAAHNADNGFYAKGTRALPGAAFTVEGGWPIAFTVLNDAGQNTFKMGIDGNIELGNRDLATQPYIDFHSGGDSTVDYDARISSIGGSNVPGSGTLVVNAQGMRFSVSRMGFFGNATAPRSTWGAPTGTGNRLTFDTATITLPELAARVKAMIDDFRSYGMFG